MPKLKHPVFVEPKPKPKPAKPKQANKPRYPKRNRQQTFKGKASQKYLQIPNTETFVKKFKYLLKKKTFKAIWNTFKEHKLGVTIENFEQKHKEATGKPFKQLRDSPNWEEWEDLIVSGLHTIKQRLKT